MTTPSNPLRRTEPVSRNKTNAKLVGLFACLALVHLVAALAGFFSPYSYREQNRQTPRAAPTKIHVFDRDGSLHLRPFIDSNQGVTQEVMVPVRFWVRGSSYELFGLVSSDLHLFGVDEPHRVFVLGTDSLGRDVFSRLLHGGQLSLTAGLAATGLALSIALLLGATAGYGPRWLDSTIMWTGDVFLSLPWIYMLLAARAFLPLDMDPAEAFFVIVWLLGLLGWAAPMRLVRGIVLGAKGREFVIAARSAGAGHVHLLRRHVLPQTYGMLATQAAVLVPAYMLAEVTLSFVGLGVGEPRPSWGNMLAELPTASALSARPWSFAPAVMIVGVTWLYHSVLSSASKRDRGAAGFGSAE
jgi:peptide/nickel transport system permease protein